MSQISEIPASAYTPEMEVLGALPDIPTFDGEPVPVSRNSLTPGTRPLQLLLLPSSEFSVRYETSQMRGFRSELLCTSQNKGDPAVLACLRDLSQVGSFNWATLGLAHLYHGLDVWTRGSGDSNWLFIRPLEERKTHKIAAHYRAEAAAETGGTAAPAGPAGVVLGDVPFTPGMEGGLDPGLGLGSGIIIPADLRQAPPPVQLDPEHTTHVLAQRYQEICQRFGFARSYIGRLYSERHELELENGRLRRHQSRQSSAVIRLQAEVERLRTRLEVEGIPLNSSDEDEGSSSSDGGPSSPPPPTVAGPSRRRR
ncbi:hypothetical protein JCGZ_04549 [Jatropha curcas]|uniref:Aminotransferase-like plant mobile domain-containing protein n=1 Tax=Jatropha curcas TaxID=180498 RepID=A0A067LP08_JATCU|nr:hypothetical protein JCGZ_04549 [Jatropha curcas]